MLLETAVYPEFEVPVRELVCQHQKSKNGKLRLAVYFAPPRRAKHDIFLFEVIDGFGGDIVEPDEKLFEFGYGSTPGLPLPEGTNLRMVLTNQPEFRHAIEHGWKGVRELRAARLADRTTVVYADAVGKRLWAKLK
jgi:hypothetical protein